MPQFIRKLVRESEGATAIEYGLIAALIENREATPSLPPTLVEAAQVLSCRPSAELSALGWQPRVGLAEGLRQTIEWERSRNIRLQERSA